MADILNFEKEDIEILETFEFEEEIQRPEELRFYTLDQRLNDFFEKMMPVKMTRYKEKELRHLRDRIRESYEKTIFVTESDYVINTGMKIDVDWIHPVYSEIDYEEYSYKKQWIPVFSKEQRRISNYYPRLIGALPRPYKTSGEGKLSKGMIVDKEGKNPLNVLDNYVSTKTIINDDGTFSIVNEVYSNTDDKVKTIGYFLDERPIIPRTIEHPFFKTNKSSFIESTASLENIFPSIESILEHAIPTSRDPYNEGLKLLKLYGVPLSKIPWMSWKERFFPAEYRDVPIPIKEIPLQPSENEKPSENILKIYSSWNSAYDPRFWLAQQVDGGQLVSKILLSDANSVGSLSTYPYLENIQYTFPETEAEICQGFTKSFDAFLESGLYREIKGKGQCIPVTTILQEKVAQVYKDKISWKETTKHELIQDYQKVLKSFILHDFKKEETYKKFEVKEESERRKDVLAILKDTERESEDKAESLEVLMRDLEFTNNNYFDLAQNFVMCRHTIEILRGSLKDSLSKFKFYSEWTFSIEGSRTCKFCGEHINNDTFVATKEYDSDGHLTMEYTPLNSESVSLHSLTTIKPLFDIENSGESILYMILSYLQVVPIDQQLIPILQRIRALSQSLKLKARQTKKISEEDQQFTEGLFGIAGAIVLMQTHNPFLIPKRKFDSSGYPRDTEDPEKCQILKSIIQLLQTYLKMFPVLYKGGISIILRRLLKDSDELKVNALRWVQQFHLFFKSLFDNAQERYVQPEINEIPNSFFIPMKLIKIENENFFNQCKIFKSGLSWKLKRNYVYQAYLSLQSKIIPSIFELIDKKEINQEYENFSDQDTRKRLSLGLSGFPFEKFIKTADSSAYFSLINQILNSMRKTSFELKEQIKYRLLISKIPLESLSLQRDILKGLLLELLSLIKKNAPLTRTLLNSLKSDLTLKIMLTDKEDAETQDFILRAKERNDIKSALRHMNDDEREISQKLLSLGLSEFIITNKMREYYFKEYENTNEIAEEEEYTERDYVENGNLPIAQDGSEMLVDYGDYGDRAVRDYDDYTTQAMEE